MRNPSLSRNEKSSKLVIFLLTNKKECAILFHNRINEIKGESEMTEKQKRLINSINGTGEFYTEQELLEILLSYTIPNNAEEVSKELIQQFGSFAEVFDRGEYASFKSNDALGGKSAMLLSLVSAIIRKYQFSKAYPKELNQITDYEKYFLTCLKHESEEVLMLACLTEQKYITYTKKISTGTSEAVQVNLYKLVKIVTQLNCSHIILAHNHPGGEAFPSNEDLWATKQIKENLSPFKIELVDHVIVGSGKVYSMKKHKNF